VNAAPELAVIGDNLHADLRGKALRAQGRKGTDRRYRRLALLRPEQVTLAALDMACGASLSRLPDSRICYSLPSCSPPCTDQTDTPALESFYFQASDGSVALPVAGYDYNSDWTGPFILRDGRRQM